MGYWLAMLLRSQSLNFPIRSPWNRYRLPLKSMAVASTIGFASLHALLVFHELQLLQQVSIPVSQTSPASRRPFPHVALGSHWGLFRQLRTSVSGLHPAEQRELSTT